MPLLQQIVPPSSDRLEEEGKGEKERIVGKRKGKEGKGKERREKERKEGKRKGKKGKGKERRENEYPDRICGCLSLKRAVRCSKKEAHTMI